MSDFFHMGGYAFYVWLSYGLTAVILIANVIIPVARDKQVKRDLMMRVVRESAKESGKEHNHASSS